MDIIYDIKKAVIELEEKYDYAQKILRSSQKGSIQIVNDPDYLRVSWLYYENGKRIRKGIKTRKAIIQNLMRKAYYKEYASRLKQNIDALKSIERKLVPMDFESLLEAMPANTHLLDEEYNIQWDTPSMHPVFDNSVPVREFSYYVPVEERSDWAERPYRANTLHTEHLVHRTPEGLYMRSKSEIALRDIYKRHRYATHYDELLMFGNVCKSPDFVSMRHDGKLIIHEHCGMINDPEYWERHKQKLALYESFGIVPWDNLIVTYEAADGSIDLALAEAEIYAKLK